MSTPDRWTTADFDSLSWHDCHVHGLAVVTGEHGTGELRLDLDFIVEWLCEESGACTFRIAPATLAFHDVSGLRVEIDYAAVQAGMTPFSLDGIERERASPPGWPESFRWHLRVNWPAGSISFESAGFTQVLRGEPIPADRQWLLPGERCRE